MELDSLAEEQVQGLVLYVFLTQTGYFAQIGSIVEEDRMVFDVTS
jgi:hypothetical protein